MTQVTALTVLNRGDLTPLVTEKAIGLAGDDKTARQRIWVRLREALLKLTVVAGQAKVLGTQRALLSVIKTEDLPSAEGVRDFTMTRAQGIQKCFEYMASMLDEQAAAGFAMQLNADKSFLGHDHGERFAMFPMYIPMMHGFFKAWAR